MYYFSESDLMGLEAFLTLFLVLKSAWRKKRKRVQFDHLMGSEGFAQLLIYPEGWDHVLNKTASKLQSYV
jgi:hypothetical protein